MKYYTHCRQCDKKLKPTDQIEGFCDSGYGIQNKCIKAYYSAEDTRTQAAKTRAKKELEKCKK